MRKSFILEIFIIIFSGLGGILLFIGEWYGYLLGMIIVFLVSYFLVSKLKEQTIKEYKEAVL